MAIKPLSQFNEQDIVNAVNTIFGDHDKYKLYIDFSNHMEDTDDESIDNTGNVSGSEAFQTGSNVIQIPVNPEKLGVANEADTETANILGLGEVNLLKGTHLKTIEIESFFPNTYRTLTISNNITKIKNIFSYLSDETIDTGNVSSYANMIEGLYRFGKGQMPPYVTTGYIAMSHHEFKEKFVNAVENNTVVNFIATGANINMLCTIESFDWDIRYGCDDIYYKMTLKEYKKFKYSKVGEKSNEYCPGDIVKYKKTTSSSNETEGTIEKVDIKNGVKMYKVQDTGMTDTTDISSVTDAMKDINKYTELDSWIRKEQILCKMVGQ